MGNRVGSSPTDRMQRKGCRPVIRAFELIDRAASFFGNERSKYHGGDFRLQMAEKGCAQIVMKSDSKKRTHPMAVLRGACGAAKHVFGLPQTFLW